MTRQMTATEAKAKILSLLDEVADGEDIVISPSIAATAVELPSSLPADRLI